MKHIRNILLLTSIIGVISCSNKNTEQTSTDDDSILINNYETTTDNDVDTPENDDKRSLEFKRALAEEAIVKAREDVKLAKEAIHRKIKNAGSSYNSTGDDEADRYRQRLKIEELERKQRVLDNILSELYEDYDNRNYQGVIEQGDRIATMRIELE